MSITATELKLNLSKYLLLAATEDIFITKNGKLVPTENISKTMFVNFKQCAGMDYFKHEEDDEYK